MSVRIIVDSTSDLTPQMRQRVKALPLSVRFGDTEYLDGVNLTAEGFYQKLADSKENPTTSQVTPYAFSEAFEEAIAAGDSVVVITISSKLSGTYQSAVVAAADYPDQVFVVDSQTAAIGTSILIQYALDQADKGVGARELAEELTQLRSKVQLAALVDTLEYLKRGGRVSKTVAFAGTLLSIKPLIAVNGNCGEVEVIGKARGNKQGNSMLIQQVKDRGLDYSKPVMLGYTGLDDELFQKFRADIAPLWEGQIAEPPHALIGCAIGTHVGPGAVAIAFFEK